MEHEEGQCPGCGTAWVGNSGFAPVEGTFPSRNATACAVHRAAPELLSALERLAPESNIRFAPGGRCRFCGDSGSAHQKDCAWVQARAAIKQAKEGK